MPFAVCHKYQVYLGMICALTVSNSRQHIGHNPLYSGVNAVLYFNSADVLQAGRDLGEAYSNLVSSDKPLARDLLFQQLLRSQSSVCGFQALLISVRAFFTLFQTSLETCFISNSSSMTFWSPPSVTSSYTGSLWSNLHAIKRLSYSTLLKIVVMVIWIPRSITRWPLQ